LKNKIKNHLKKDLLSSSVIEDNISEMFTKIKNTKVLIINENKYDWRNRYHVSSLLDTLQKMGFHTVSMEALYESDTIKNKKLPLLNDGFNTLEPAMTNLIRKAKKENWNILNYNYENNIFDTISKRYPNISGREWSQAIHLVEYIKNNPNEKILIYSGGSQMYNKNQDKAQMRLSEILNKFWEIKSITIDQTYFNDLDVYILPNNNEINPFRYYKKEKFLKYNSTLFNKADFYSISSLKENDFFPQKTTTSNPKIIALKSITDSLKLKSDCSIEIYPKQEVEKQIFSPCYLFFYSNLKREVPMNIYLDSSQEYVLYIRATYDEVLYRKIF
jgi:hypothetical protein